MECDISVFEGFFFADAIENVGDFEKGEGFGEKVVCTFPNSTDCIIPITVAGDDYADGFRGVFADVVDDIPAAAAGHFEVDDGSVEDISAGGFECSGGGLADGCDVAEARQVTAHHLSDSVVVVDKQDTKTVAFTRIHGLLHGTSSPFPFGRSLANWPGEELAVWPSPGRGECICFGFLRQRENGVETSGCRYKKNNRFLVNSPVRLIHCDRFRSSGRTLRAAIIEQFLQLLQSLRQARKTTQVFAR